jgi:hypothetical protein
VAEDEDSGEQLKKHVSLTKGQVKKLRARLLKWLQTYMVSFTIGPRIRGMEAIIGRSQIRSSITMEAQY